MSLSPYASVVSPIGMKDAIAGGLPGCWVRSDGQWLRSIAAVTGALGMLGACAGAVWFGQLAECAAAFRRTD